MTENGSQGEAKYEDAQASCSKEWLKCDSYEWFENAGSGVDSSWGESGPIVMFSLNMHVVLCSPVKQWVGKLFSCFYVLVILLIISLAQRWAFS